MKKLFFIFLIFTLIGCSSLSILEKTHTYNLSENELNQLISLNIPIKKEKMGAKLLIESIDVKLLENGYMLLTIYSDVQFRKIYTKTKFIVLSKVIYKDNQFFLSDLTIDNVEILDYSSSLIKLNALKDKIRKNEFFDSLKETASKLIKDKYSQLILKELKSIPIYTIDNEKLPYNLSEYEILSLNITKDNLEIKFQRKQ